MTVVVLLAAPSGLRGHVTRWMVEVSPGVFVGTPNTRVRDKLWATISERIKGGQAILIVSSRNEQRWTVQTAGVDRWVPVDLDGLQLIRRPTAGDR